MEILDRHLNPAFGFGASSEVAAPQSRSGAVQRFWSRYLSESAWYKGRGVGAALADVAAARVAAQGHVIDTQFGQSVGEAQCAGRLPELPKWIEMMAAETPPSFNKLRAFFSVSIQQATLIQGIWDLLGATENLMVTGGDIRLERDSRTGLNGYGCSHRPRPWAITFASSTASSVSERGYDAADHTRLFTTLSLLLGHSRGESIRESLDDVREQIARILKLPGNARVILAASGTDTELLGLALTHIAGDPAKPILNILLAPEETGRGVPAAARGLHFSVSTALGHKVACETLVSGFRPDTELLEIPLRDNKGQVRSSDHVEKEIRDAIGNGVMGGRRILLHVLDVSKTGLLAPSMAFLKGLRQEFGNRFDIVVDACQARLSGKSIRVYLALDAIVTITGSKFFTGPPFAGAAILPPSICRRLLEGSLPSGLGDYYGRDEFYSGCAAATKLSNRGNYGLALRWEAALAEMREFFSVPETESERILEMFRGTVEAAVSAFDGLRLLSSPAVFRSEVHRPWERIRTIFTFSIAAPHSPGRSLTPAEAYSVYIWLNSDLSGILGSRAGIASKICHIGQPVALATESGIGLQGALRISAGGRLVSGEPSHDGLQIGDRLIKEMSDLLIVFEKLRLILGEWSILNAIAPAP